MAQNMRYTYEADWRQYAFPEQNSGFATEQDLVRCYQEVDLDQAGTLDQGGIPIASDGHRAIINGENEHAIIYGATASKKTRTLILPLMAILAKARESMVVLDIKGELSDGVTFPQVRGLLDEAGYQCRYFNLRDMDGDAFNLLLEPYKLYQAGKKDEAMVMVNDLVESLAGIYKGSSADPFWEMTAKQYLASVIVLIFEMCKDPQKVNMLSLAAYTNWDACEDMKAVAELIPAENNIMTMLRAVVSEPDRTRMSTLATVNSMMTPFVANEKLLRMLSQSTFDLHELSEKPTVLFLIVPDEVDTYAGIVGLMLSQISSVLVQDAYRKGGRLPIRVNFLCDEFNNYYIPNMRRSISAHRSRNIRWYIVCQSQKQLESCYPKEADTIMANCTNTFFLNSPELSLMEHLSQCAGYTTITPDGNPKPILTVADLQGLKKGWTHTDVYFSSGGIHYVSKLPDISGYAFLDRYKNVSPVPRNTFPVPPVFNSQRMRRVAQTFRDALDRKKNEKDLDSLPFSELLREYARMNPMFG